MKKLLTTIIALFMCNSFLAQDWANLKKYQSVNKKLLSTHDNARVVFMGNSITEGWKEKRPKFFKDNNFINRGISGQTTPQMLVRFRQDVVQLHPKLVVILAGTNDIAGNTGHSTLEMILDNIKSMCEISKANNIKIILSSVIPAFDYPWSSGKKPNEKISMLNKMIKNYCLEQNIFYLDYFSAMVDEKNGLRDEYTYDGVHPNDEGYKVMEPLVKEAINQCLKK